MSKESRELLEKLDVLAKKVEILSRITAISSRTEKLLGKKTKTEQIQILKKWELPNEIIALVIGTTPETVAVRLSEIKSKTRKKKQPKPEEGQTE